MKPCSTGRKRDVPPVGEIVAASQKSYAVVPMIRAHITLSCRRQATASSTRISEQTAPWPSHALGEGVTGWVIANRKPFATLTDLDLPPNSLRSPFPHVIFIPDH